MTVGLACEHVRQGSCFACIRDRGPIRDATATVLAEVERVDAARGLDIVTPLGTGGPRFKNMAYASRADYDACERAGAATMALALREEVYEALAEDDPERLYAELTQVAAVALRMMRRVRAGG